MIKRIVSISLLSTTCLMGALNIAPTIAHAATVVPSTQGTTTTQNLGQPIADYAQTLLGIRYTHGGKSPSTGFDCSGFTYYVHKHFGINISTGPAGQLKQGVKIAKSQIQPGDVVFFRSENAKSGYHEGIYIGNAQFIHAPAPGRKVEIKSFNSSWYQQRFLQARRMY